ncbi:MAG TPA: hypothetical protein DCZ00_06890 [Lactococcus sp.]|uniref:hypothetical protein n=1 Tax=Lactococcus TaxID=1357 RepID=UPI000E93D1C0|nr:MULTISPECIES: hypothetical protein [Lactococcus]HAP15077.1 hypothetical protein [Lactococcus sp.]HBC91149.1 hypothetical protein [Lactococcus sp.]
MKTYIPVDIGLVLFFALYVFSYCVYYWVPNDGFTTKYALLGTPLIFIPLVFIAWGIVNLFREYVSNISSEE